jgi:hypothetical protein
VSADYVFSESFERARLSGAPLEVGKNVRLYAAVGFKAHRTEERRLVRRGLKPRPFKA